MKAGKDDAIAISWHVRVRSSLSPSSHILFSFFLSFLPSFLPCPPPHALWCHFCNDCPAADALPQGLWNERFESGFGEEMRRRERPCVRGQQWDHCFSPCRRRLFVRLLTGNDVVLFPLFKIFFFPLPVLPLLSFLAFDLHPFAKRFCRCPNTG